MRDYSWLRERIREIPDFPVKGVKFKDIAPLLEDPKALKDAVDGLADAFRDKGVKKVVGVDSRGFLLASPVAYLLGAGIVMARKKGKLPFSTVSREHTLEYGKGTLEIHKDAIYKGEKILIVDDALATGGTAEAAAKLVEELGGIVVGIGFLFELSLELPIKARERLSKYRVTSLIKY